MSIKTILLARIIVLRRYREAQVKIARLEEAFVNQQETIKRLDNYITELKLANGTLQDELVAAIKSQADLKKQHAWQITQLLDSLSHSEAK